MRQEEEDIEASAHLIFDKNEPVSNGKHSSWSRLPFMSYSRHLWRRVQSLSVSSGLPTRRLSQVSSRYLTVFVIAVLLVSASLIHTSRVTSALLRLIGRAPPEFCTTWPVDAHGDYDVHSHDRTDRVELDSIAPPGGWRKPEGFKVVAMVFYGRRRYVDILDCYLQQNLASNGGYLDEVWFMMHTDNEDDIAWVNDLADRTPGYKIVGEEDCNKNDRKYGCLWAYASEDNTMYIKLDDDIIYIHQDAIPQLVHTRLAVPHAFAVSAQLVNSPVTGIEQFHHNAIYPFVPDSDPMPRHRASETWRPSELERYPAGELAKLKKTKAWDIMYPDVPYTGHPFKLLSEDNFDLLHTSMGQYDQNPGKDPIAFSPIWRSWAMAAQQQYSLLYNLEKNQISRYFFGKPAPYLPSAEGPDPNTTVAVPRHEGKAVLGGEQIFDTQFRRYNLNFCVVWGSDIKAQLPMNNDDENAITHLLPKKTGRPFIIDTRAIVGHFSFYTQIENIRQTDLLDRWRAFANEAVCAPNNLKKPWDMRCPNFL